MVSCFYVLTVTIYDVQFKVWIHKFVSEPWNLIIQYSREEPLALLFSLFYLVKWQQLYKKRTKVLGTWY